MSSTELADPEGQDDRDILLEGAVEGIAEDDRGQLWHGCDVVLPVPQVAVPLQHPHVPPHLLLRCHSAACL